MEQAAIKWYQYQPKVEVKSQTASRNEYVAWGEFVRCKNISKSILDFMFVTYMYYDSISTEGLNCQI